MAASRAETLKHTVKFLNTLDGRDQSAKLLQYGSRALMYYIRLYDPDSHAALRFERTYKGASTARKLFRLAKWLKEYQATLDSLKTKNELVRALRILQHVCLACYLACDNVVWFAKNKVVDVDSKQLGQRAANFWAIGLTSTLCGDVLDIRDTLAAKSRARAFLEDTPDHTPDGGAEEMKTDSAHRAISKADAKLFKLALSVIKVVPSIIVAANSAKWFEKAAGHKVNDGIIGLCGVVASSTNIYKTWKSV